MGNKYTTKTSRVGVARQNSNGKYIANIAYGYYNKIKKSKTFDTFEEAVKQRELWEKEREEYNSNQSPRQGLTKPPKGDPSKLCSSNCADCKFMKWMDRSRHTMFCDYYLMTDKRRPCSAGDGCIVKEVRAKNHNRLLRLYRSHVIFPQKIDGVTKYVRINKNLEMVEVKHAD